MKKKIFLILFSILSLSLSSCTLPEKAYTVNFYDENNQVIFQEKIGLHTDLLVPEIEHVYLGHKFMGWTYAQGNTSSDIRANNIMYYSKVKSKQVDGIINCYAVYKEFDYELCVGYDGRVSISGLTEKVMDNFKSALTNYINYECGFADVKIRFKDYSKDYYGNELTDIADIGSLITKENIADVLMGFGSNLDNKSYGNVTVTHKSKGVMMGGKSRYIHRRNNFVLSDLTYDFIKSYDGQKSLLPVRESEYDLVIGYDARTSYSGLSTDKINAYLNSLKTYLNTLGFESPNILLRPYSVDGAANIGNAINGDGDCDILVGFGPTINLSTGSNVSVLHMKKCQMDDYQRYVCQLTNYTIAEKAYNWTISTYYSIVTA